MDEIDRKGFGFAMLVMASFVLAIFVGVADARATFGALPGADLSEVLACNAPCLEEVVSL